MAERSALEVHLAEYNRLKDEQRARITARDNLVYVMLTVVAAIAFFSFGGASARHAALFLLPPAGYILGWVYVINDWKVSDIGRYVRTELAAAVNSCAESSGLLAWEAIHRRCVCRRYRKLLQMVTDLLVFCAPGYVAIAVYWLVAPATALFVVVSCVEIMGLGLLAVEIIRHGEISSDTS